MSLDNTMFLLIRDEICGAPSQSELSVELTAQACEKLYDLSQKHDVAHIVASALAQRGLLQNDGISSRFHKQMMTALYRDAQKEYALTHISATLEEAKVPYMLLKGAVIKELYPQTWMRTSCDVDVLVRDQDVERAMQALSAAGYGRIQDCSTHDYNFVSPNNVHIELHYTLTQGGDLEGADTLLASVWDFAVLSDGTAYRYNMSPELFLVYHLAHMGRHLLHGGCGLRPFIDLWLINQKIKFDPCILQELLTKSNLLKLYALSTELSRVWLEGASHTEKTRVFANYILNGGVYGTEANAAVVKAASGVGKVRTLIGVMFLPKANLQVLYPKLKEYPILLPYYQVKRWFRVFNKDKRKRVKGICDARSAVSSDSANETKLLLEDLGFRA